MANGIGSAGASVHDVDSPSTRTGSMLSPSMVRLGMNGKPLKAMTDKDLKAATSAYVVKNMAKYKIKLGSSEAFKKHARRITHLIADKETRSKTFKAGELTEITVVMKNKIRRFIRDYMAKLFKKQPKEERSSTSVLVNGSRNSIAHVIVMGADGAPLPPSGTIFTLPKDMENFTSQALSGTAAAGLFKKEEQLSQIMKAERKTMMGYGDVEVDDDDEVKYGEGDDDDDVDGDLDGDEDDDDANAAAVPSSSVELPL